MAVIFPRAVRTEAQSPLISASVAVPDSGKSYDVACVMFNFTNPAQGVRLEVQERISDSDPWTTATATPAVEGQFIDGGLDSRTGQMKQPALRNLTGVAGRRVRLVIHIRGSIDMRVDGTVNT